MSLRFARTANVSNRSGSISSHAAAKSSFHRPLDRPRNGVIRHARDALHPLDGFRNRRTIAQAHDVPVAGLLDALDRNPLQALPQRRVQFSQEEAAVAAFEPQLVVVHDDDGIAHAVFSRFTHRRNNPPITWRNYSSGSRPRVAVGGPSGAFNIRPVACA